MITPKTKISNLIFQNYHILPILNRFGIFPGEGDKSIDQICKEKGINPHLFMVIIELFINNEIPEDTDLEKIKITDLIAYLRASHYYFLNKNLKKIEAKINELMNACGDDAQKIILIKNFYNEFKKELIEHINHEDTTIYPYAEAIEKRQNTNSAFDINDYLENHSEIEDKIFDLKNLFIRHLKLNKNLDILNELVSEIFDFEKELNDHQRIENIILVPLVKRLQNRSLR